MTFSANPCDNVIVNQGQGQAMAEGKSAIQETIGELASRMGSGLLGKITPFFMLGLLFGAAAMGALPSEFKMHGFWFGCAALVAYTLIAGFIVLVHPILGALEGEAARKALRDAMTARNPDVIHGKISPVPLGSPAEGIGGSMPILEHSKELGQ
ncbi:hypothetical protein [Devosia aurantiaca]|uniref:Uncharacterized protein n=1 Tax=Devosia aurantiaca TaxID=2714858 RepID=A0A6M1SGH9_9HYPH|nr:hypothetical protein [Devosia aurantiaca]NGP18939.1 hypothetical protein [Devosia aurantiaca]